MAKFRFFSCLFRKTYKIESSPQLHVSEGNGSVKVKLERLGDSNNDGSHKETSFNVSVPFGVEGSSTCKVKMVGDDNLINLDQTTGADPAYEASDEHDEKSSIKRDLSDFDLQAHDKPDEPVFTFAIDPDLNEKADRGKRVFFEINESGHVSDPGTHNRAGVFVDGSPKLKRSCSNLETRDLGKRLLLQLPSSNPNSFEDLQSLYDCIPGEEGAMQGSPLSVISADKVMLKRRSSSQVLPSRSRRLWWKLFLWSHRNLHKPMNIGKRQRPLFSISETSIQKDGYASDTLEPGCSAQVMKGKTIQDSGKSDSFESFSGNLCDVTDGDKKHNFHGGVFESRPCNQWVAFSTESASFTRVDEWVNNLDTSSVSPLVNDEPEILESPRGIFEPENMDFSSAGSLEKTHYPSRQSNLNNTQEIIQANNIIHSLNSFTTVAHISGMGLKVIPAISPFSSLRSINLSGNFIVHISPGSLPKSLHTLNLSRNKIVTIEGLRDLTRLRVLDLSYNRIARIAHGLSNCTLIKELYLAGNKISDVEGLHRLLKLTVLDLSFNKITTTKALGQLVANYHSMLALNLLGNPIQTNIGDDQLRRAVTGLLPQLTYLNKQPIKPQRAREVAMDSVAKAALGGSWNAHRKSGRRGTSQGGGGGGGLGFTASLKSKNVSSVSPTARGTKGGLGGGGNGQRNRHKSKTRHSSSTRKS